MSFAGCKGSFPVNLSRILNLGTACNAVICIIFHSFISCGQNENTGSSTAKESSFFQWEYTSPESQGMCGQKLDSMAEVLAGKETKKLLIVKNDKIVYQCFAPGWEDSVRGHYTASLAKALVSGMSLLAAIDDGYIHMDEAACNYIPSWKADNLRSKITVRQLATHTSGIQDAHGTDNELKTINSKELHSHFNLPGWKGQFWKKEPDPFSISRDSVPIIFTPGTGYAYSNPGIAMLNYVVTSSLKGSAYNNIGTYLKDRIFEPIGIEENNYKIGYDKTYELDSLNLVSGWGGAFFTAKDIARIGLLMLYKGSWMGKQIIDSMAVEKVITYNGTALPVPPFNPGNLISYYRTANNPQPATTAGWYSNYDGVWESVPRDAFAGAGANNQHLLVIPSMKMVVVRMGGTLNDGIPGEGLWKGVEKYLFNPLMDAVVEAPYPKSDLSVEFAPKEMVVRMAEGSDNWPLTWGDDDVLYTAFGDGNGFIPKTEIKLSLGLAKISGNAPSVKGINLRSGSGERVGQGNAGEKASGMLMVDGVLYMLVRNAQNAKLMWSSDHGKNWEEANWKFDVSFGSPAFLNYGKNYEGATDDYVYIFSQDEASAYENSDQFVLARVPKNQIKEWRKYEYYSGYDKKSHPTWTDDIRKREPVFNNPGKCYRSGITYNSGLKRYFWCQSIRLSPAKGYHKDLRYRGGLGIFESEHPWGPWRTVYYSRNWDIGPGETSSIPTKWMSEDAKSCYLLFSGDDCFSMRKLTIKKYELSDD